MIQKIKAAITKSQEYAKLIAALIGGVLTIGATFIPDDWRSLAVSILAAVTAYSVWRFPNTSSAPADAPAGK